MKWMFRYWVNGQLNKTNVLLMQTWIIFYIRMCTVFSYFVCLWLFLKEEEEFSNVRKVFTRRSTSEEFLFQNEGNTVKWCFRSCKQSWTSTRNNHILLGCQNITWKDRKRKRLRFIRQQHRLCEVFP